MLWVIICNLHGSCCLSAKVFTIQIFIKSYSVFHLSLCKENGVIFNGRSLSYNRNKNKKSSLYVHCKMVSYSDKLLMFNPTRFEENLRMKPENWPYLTLFSSTESQFGTPCSFFYHLRLGFCSESDDVEGNTIIPTSILWTLNNYLL